ncbi:MAG: polyamine aminopropyltransferase [Calditrichaeota bacterium]|nr:polyamine aminopropyltransferase [Calditrichota bacterium]MCB9391576.1 polyamine aminopropyltransferase [Calditrichota bacterium]
MELWLTETYGPIRGGWKAGRVLYSKQSKYQLVEVVETERWGKTLVLDGCMMTTERDEFVYHEMLSHPALVTHSSPKSVCVVGGGDGGTVREVLRHPGIERVVLAEIDGDVIDVSREFFPEHTSMLNDPRVDIQVGDGFAYLQSHPGEFDVILSDSTDPVGPGEVLFTQKYFDLAKRALRENGVFVTQAHSPWDQDSRLGHIRKVMKEFFAQVHWYGAPIPTYPYGWWSFFFASDRVHPLESAQMNRQQEITQHSKYYTPAIHDAAFAVPAFLAREFGLSL